MTDRCDCMECMRYDAHERLRPTISAGCRCLHCWTGEDEAEWREAQQSAPRQESHRGPTLGNGARSSDPSSVSWGNIASDAEPHGRIMVTTYNLFISHSWRYSDAYERLVALLKARPYFDFHDYSVPPDDPIHDAPNDTALRKAIRDQMQLCHVVLVLAGVYATYSKWINIEIEIAKKGFTKSKPIVAIRPWGAEHTSRTVTAAADKIVGWNTESIVSAIRELG